MPAKLAKLSWHAAFCCEPSTVEANHSVASLSTAAQAFEPPHHLHTTIAVLCAILNACPPGQGQVTLGLHATAMVQHAGGAYIILLPSN